MAIHVDHVEANVAAGDVEIQPGPSPQHRAGEARCALKICGAQHGHGCLCQIAIAAKIKSRHRRIHRADRAWAGSVQHKTLDSRIAIIIDQGHSGPLAPFSHAVHEHIFNDAEVLYHRLCAIAQHIHPQVVRREAKNGRLDILGQSALRLPIVYPVSPVAMAVHNRSRGTVSQLIACLQSPSIHHVK